MFARGYRLDDFSLVGGLEHVLFVHSVGNVIITTDFHSYFSFFQRGRSTRKAVQTQIEIDRSLTRGHHERGTGGNWGNQSLGISWIFVAPAGPTLGHEMTTEQGLRSTSVTSVG